jgi:hypothetical protein
MNAELYAIAICDCRLRIWKIPRRRTSLLIQLAIGNRQSQIPYFTGSTNTAVP